MTFRKKTSAVIKAKHHYAFGDVVAYFRTRAGLDRFVFEYKDHAGLLRICNESQIIWLDGSKGYVNVIKPRFLSCELVRQSWSAQGWCVADFEDMAQNDHCVFEFENPSGMLHIVNRSQLNFKECVNAS